MIEKCSVYYVATIQDKIVGVFSSHEKAPAGANLSEITPIRIEGSPRSEEYICMAKGGWSVVHYNDGQFSGEDFETEPIWGCNPQSAIAGLFGYNLSRRSVIMTDFVLYEINKEYLNEDVKNLFKTAPFSGIAYSISKHSKVTPEVASTDYIKWYFDEKKKHEEYIKRLEMTNVSDTSNRLINLKCSIIQQKEKMRFCGTYLSSQRRLLEKHLLRLFSTNDLILLSEILRTVDGKPVSEALSYFKDLSDEKRKLVKEAFDCVPPVGGRKISYGAY